MRRVGAFLVALLFVTGCTGSPATTTLVIYAAASLESVFTTLAHTFETEHPRVNVAFSFEGSATLVDQLAAGAPADVVATADASTMSRAVTQHLVDTPQTFTTNVLTLIVPADNPARITGFDASLAGTKLVICAPEVPCGAATASLAELNNLVLQPASEESKVTDVRAKVETGQADAGVVYATDARGTKVRSFAIPHADEVRNEYQIAVTASPAQLELASQFVTFTQTTAAQRALAEAGFGS